MCNDTGSMPVDRSDDENVRLAKLQAEADSHTVLVRVIAKGRWHPWLLGPTASGR